MAHRPIVLSGLPGAGSTSAGAWAARRLDSVRPSTDTIEESILARGLPAGWRVGVAAYESARLAEFNLRLGHDAVVDGVNDTAEALNRLHGSDCE